MASPKLPQKPPDPFHKIKYMGYCLSQLPPIGVESTFEDFVNYAKFHLSVDKHVLMEDPIWDLYTDEQLLVEYFANLFMKSKERLQEFEGAINVKEAIIEDFNTWADKMIAEEDRKLAEKADKLEDKVSFRPDSLGE